MPKQCLSLACPYCNCQKGTDLHCVKKDEYQKEERELSTFITIHRFYECRCDICKKDYNVDYGYAQLIKYKPFIYNNMDRTKLFVEYNSQFDRSYKIMEVDDITMMIIDDDDTPIIIKDDEKEYLITEHGKAKTYAYYTWMNRHR